MYPTKNIFPCDAMDDPGAGDAVDEAKEATS